MESYILIGIIVVCTLFLLVGVIRRRPEIIVNFAMRALTGTAAIYTIDFVMRMRGYGLAIGINALTVMVNGFLGFPGFLLLYALSIYYSFR